MPYQINNFLFGMEAAFIKIKTAIPKNKVSHKLIFKLAPAMPKIKKAAI